MNQHMTHNTDPSALWDSLITSATLGTDRRACAPPAVPGPLGALLAGLDLSDAEGALLGGAAACALAMRAGRLPPAVPEGEEIPPCPEEDLPECSPAARQHLALMLQGHHRAALPEWLAALVARGMRAPAAHLPDLLDLGRVQEELRPRILATLGARGRWLASLNPAWDYASAELKMLRAEHSGTTRSTQHAARSTWETSPRPTRLALLRAVRAADPVAGRELLRSTWASEKADDRAAFLAELRAGLGPGDEPFLEAALDDRSKEVRATAADLLSRLPGSQLSQRMCERLRPLLSWWPGEPAKLLGLRLGRGPRLEAVLPAAYDKGMARDGVEQRPRSTALGERAWWLAQMLAAVPPAEWSAAWHTAPEELVQAALQHELADALLSGWWAATARHPDAAWAEALLIHATRRTLAAIAAGGSTAQALVEQLPPEHFERFALAQLGVPGGLELIAAAQRPWSLTLARAAVAALQAELRKGARSVWRDGYLLQAIGQRAPAALYAEFDRGWPTDAPAWPQWAGYVAQARELLEFRYVMLKEI